MVFLFKFILRHLSGVRKKQRRAFSSDKEFYDFCRGLYKKSGGATPELLEAYDFYQNNIVAYNGPVSLGDKL